MAVTSSHLRTGPGTPGGIEIPYVAHVNASGVPINPATAEGMAIATYVLSASYTVTITTTSIIPTAFGSITLPADLVRIVLIPRGDLYWKINAAATAATALIGQGSWLSLPVTKTLADTIQVYAAGAGVACDLLVCTAR